jgi:hypothetical protein
VYFVGAMTGFALWYWATGAVSTWHQAFLASGSYGATYAKKTVSERPTQQDISCRKAITFLDLLRLSPQGNGNLAIVCAGVSCNSG